MADIQISINIGEAKRAHGSRIMHLGQSQESTIVNLKLETRKGNWNTQPCLRLEKLVKQREKYFARGAKKARLTKNNMELND